MKPYIICHMLSSVDGRIDGDSLDAVMSADDYEAVAAKLGGNAWMCGRTTMQLHFAEEASFVSTSNTPAGPRPVFVARQAESYVVSVDTLGKLRWASGDLDGEHLVCVVSEGASADYLDYLREKHISFIVAGGSSVDLAKAMNLLGEHFGIRTLLLEGGGHINGAFFGGGPHRRVKPPAGAWHRRTPRHPGQLRWDGSRLTRRRDPQAPFCRAAGKRYPLDSLRGEPVLVSFLMISSLGGNALAQAKSQFVRLAKLQIEPAQLEAYKTALKEEIETSVRVEPGVVSLSAVAEKDHPDRVTILEVYADAEAYNAHLVSPHFKRYKAAVETMVKSLELVETVPIALAAKVR